MINQKKNNFKNEKRLLIYFFFVFPKEKYLRELKESLKIYNIILHKNTEAVKKTLRVNETPMLHSITQANYIGISSQNIEEKCLEKILSLFLTKNIKYIPFAIFYNQKILRSKLGINNTNHSFLFHSITHD